MYQITDFTKRCVYDCYVLMKKCVDFEHIEDSEFVLSTFKQIGQYKIALPPELNKHIEQFLEKTLHPIIDDNEFFLPLQNLNTARTMKKDILKLIRKGL